MKKCDFNNLFIKLLMNSTFVKSSDNIDIDRLRKLEICYLFCFTDFQSDFNCSYNEGYKVSLN